MDLNVTGTDCKQELRALGLMLQKNMTDQEVLWLEAVTGVKILGQGDLKIKTDQRTQVTNKL